MRIGNDQSSPVSPIFEVLEKPNEWDRKVSDTKNEALNQLQKFRHDFWQSYAQEYPDDIQLRPDHIGANVFHNMNGLVISQYLGQRGIGVYLQKENRRYTQEDRDRAQSYQEKLAEHGIVAGPNAQHVSTSLSVSSTDRDNWPRMREWLHETLGKFREILQDET